MEPIPSVKIQPSSYKTSLTIMQSLSSVGTLIYAMMLHPEVRRKAQAELDRVVGRDRLPSLADRQNLPYITAIYREGMRYIET